MEALPVIDRERLLRISRSDADRARAFFRAFVGDAEMIAERMRVAHLSGDDDLLRDLAHALRGMALEVGAPRVALTAAALEAERDSTVLPGRFDAVGRACAELRRAFEMLSFPDV